MSQDLEKLLQEAPSLTLEPFAQETQPPVAQEMQEVAEKSAAEQEREKLKSVLSPAEQKQVDEFVRQIDIGNSQMVLQYGAGSQKKIADFSEAALGNVRTKDLGEIGEELARVVTELKSFEDEEEEKGFLGFFNKCTNRLATLKAKYEQAEDNVDRTCRPVKGQQNQML